jgi:hypothetical protein
MLPSQESGERLAYIIYDVSYVAGAITRTLWGSIDNVLMNRLGSNRENHLTLVNGKYIGRSAFRDTHHAMISVTISSLQPRQPL